MDHSRIQTYPGTFHNIVKIRNAANLLSVATKLLARDKIHTILKSEVKKSKFCGLLCCFLPRQSSWVFY